MISTSIAAFDAFVELAPDGRRLDEHEAARARDLLVEVARCGRALDAERELVAGAADEAAIRSTRELLRSIRHSLVLALADDAATRARSMPLQELGARARPVFGAWKRT